MPRGEFGLIGLGKIGSQIAERMNSRGYEIIGYDSNASLYEMFRGRANFVVAQGVSDMEDLEQPRLVMLSVPAGAVDGIIKELTGCLSADDTIADLGNSNWKESIRRYDSLQKKDINFLDVGITGGLEIECEGAGMMVGGDKEVFERYKDVLGDIAARDGLVYVGAPGMGHFVKMLHNAVEYVWLQGLAEGAGLMEDMSDLQEQSDCMPLPIADILRVWEKGVNPRLIRYAAEVYEDLKNGKIDAKNISGKVGGGETGKWAKEYADEVIFDAPALDTALREREESDEDSPTGKLINLLRNRFGGHPCQKKDE